MVFDKLKKCGELVMFSHIVFSLPFGLLAMLWAADGMPELKIFFWILVCFHGKRFMKTVYENIILMSS